LVGAEENRMPKVADLHRNEVFTRLNDAQLSWLDAHRGELPRSTFIRSLIEQLVVRGVESTPEERAPGVTQGR
jgi:hypothetical protein